MTKPFAFAELVARLHALLRRGGADTAVEAAGLRLDPVTHAVEAGSGTVPLSPTEFRLLARLLARPGEAVRRRDLIRAAWPLGAIVRDNTLDAYIARLRRKLRQLPAAPEIATVHGVGYRIAMMHGGLRRRLLLVVVTAVAVAVCGLVAAFDLRARPRLERDASTLVRTRAAAELATLQLSRSGVREAEAPNDATPAAGIWVFSNGRAIEKPRVGPSVQSAARSAAARPLRYTTSPAADLRLYAVPVLFHGKRVGTVVAATSLAPYEESRRTALIGSLVFAVLVLGLVVAAAWWLLAHALQPVVQMTRQAAAWSERDLDKRFALGEPTDELTELAATLDGLLDRLATTLRHEQRFSAELSHELRTPLARVIGEAELALRRERGADDYRAALELILRNAQQLARTVDALVAAARHQVETPRRQRRRLRRRGERSRGRRLGGRRAASWPSGSSRRRGRSGSASTATSAERILQPVIENACRYGRSTVSVSIGRLDGTVAYLVEDDGPGVAEDEREAIFEPGSRGSVGSGDGSSGAGLGLALARRLARSVAGDVVATGEGFRITLPRG